MSLSKTIPTGYIRTNGRRLGDIFEKTFKYWALAPALVLLILFTLYPIISLIVMSFHRNQSVGGKILWTFVGLQNVHRLLFEDYVFRAALRNTLTFVGAVVIIEMLLGFFLALLISRIPRGKGLIRTIMVLPIFVPAVAIGNMWRLMYSYDTGILNQALEVLGLSPVLWLSSLKTAMISVIMVDVWHWVPFVFLIALAGFESLDIETMEAARVDGAGGWRLLRYIVVPLMWPTLSVILMLRTIFAFKVFDEIWLLTRGGPGTATEVLSLHIYKVFFLEDLKGYGSLISVVTIMMTLAMIYIFRRQGRREE